MTDDPQLAAVDGGAPAAPVFGRRSTPLDERKYRQFGLEVETSRERFDVMFDAYLDPDGGAVLNLMNARTQWQQANATAVLLGTSLRDDDGADTEWQVPVEPAVDDDGEPVLGEPDEAHPDGVPLWEWWNGDLLTRDEVDEATRAFDPLVEGSSRRRFQYVMDSPHHRVQLSALNEVAEWIIGDVAKRPTRRPTPSQRGPQPTRRTGAGRR